MSMCSRCPTRRRLRRLQSDTRGVSDANWTAAGRRAAEGSIQVWFGALCPSPCRYEPFICGCVPVLLLLGRAYGQRAACFPRCVCVCVCVCLIPDERAWYYGGAGPVGTGPIQRPTYKNIVSGMKSASVAASRSTSLLLAALAHRATGSAAPITAASEMRRRWCAKNERVCVGGCQYNKEHTVPCNREQASLTDLHRRVCDSVRIHTDSASWTVGGGGTAHRDKRKSRPCFLAEIVLTVQSVRNLLINSYDHVVNLLYYSTVNKLSMIMKFSILLLVRPKR